MKAEEFDKKFDDDEEDIIEYLDLSKARRLGTIQSSVPSTIKRPACYVVVKGTRFFSAPVINGIRRIKSKH